MYSKALEKIKLSPWIGNPMSLDETGGEYAHNLFLQVGEDLGVIAIIVLVFFLLYALYKIVTEKYTFEERMLIAVLFSTSIGRLLFSSTLWRRPEFWMLVSYVLVLPNRMILGRIKR